MAKTVGFNFSIGARLQSSVVSAFDTVAGRTKKMRADFKQLEKINSVSAKLIKAHDRKLEKEALFNVGRATQKQLDATKTAYARAQRAARDYGVTIANAAESQAKANIQMRRTEAALKRQAILQRNRDKRSELRGEIMGTVASVAAVAAPIKMAMDFEDTFADLKKVADFANAAEEKQVKENIFDVARMSGLTAENVTAIAASAAESGVIKNASGAVDPELLKEFLTDAAVMSVAFGISAEEAGQRMKSFRTNLKLSADEAREMNDSINWLGSNMNATAEATSRVVSRMGGVGKTVGMSAKSIAALSGALVATSQSPEEAGTAFKNFLLNLAKGDRMTTAQKNTLESMGLNAKELAIQMKKGGKESEKAILGVFKAMQKMPDYEMAGIANELFGTQSIASLSPLINDLGMLEKAFALVHDEAAKGSQMAEFKTRMETTGSSVGKIKTELGLMAITVGSVALPAVAAMAEGINSFLVPVTKYIEANPQVVTGLMTVAGAMAAYKVATLAGGYAMTVFSNAGVMLRTVLTPLIWVTGLLTKTTYGQAVATKIAAVSQRVLNVVMRANPIGLIIGAVSALAGWFVILYNKTGSVRGALSAMWEACLNGVKTLLKPLEWALGAIGKIVSWLSSDEAEEADGKVSEELAKIDAPVAEGKTVAHMHGTVSAPPDIALPEGLLANMDFAISDATDGFNEEAALAELDGMNLGALPDMGALGTMGGMGATIAPTFTFQFDMSGIPDKDFGQRVLDSVESKKSDIARILSELLNDVQRRGYA